MERTRKNTPRIVEIEAQIGKLVAELSALVKPTMEDCMDAYEDLARLGQKAMDDLTVVRKACWTYGRERRRQQMAYHKTLTAETRQEIVRLARKGLNPEQIAARMAVDVNVQLVDEAHVALVLEIEEMSGSGDAGTEEADNGHGPTA